MTTVRRSIAVLAAVVVATSIAGCGDKSDKNEPGASGETSDTKFVIQRAQLTQQSDGSWTGPATLDGVDGRLTVTGDVVLLEPEEHRIRFDWVAGSRSVSGCSFNTVLTRPHGVQLWDGSGQITKTSKLERTYMGVHVSLSGPTKSDDLTHAQISVGSFTKKPDLPYRDC